MPEMGGAELLHRLETVDPEHARRVVFVTGGAFSSELSTFLASTPNPQISKPFTAEELLAAIG